METRAGADGDDLLLAAYAATRDGAAFRRLVERHLPLVHSAARRQLAGDAAAADDVAQAVFLLLAERPGRVRRGTLAGWLLVATRRVAGQWRRSARRRATHERIAAAAAEKEPSVTDSASAATADELRGVLDAALARLGATDRSAVAIRHLQGRPLADVAAALGVSEGAAATRLSRALARLRRHLVAAGATTLPTATAGLGDLLTVAAGPHVAPPDLVARVTAAAIAAPPATGALLASTRGAASLMTRRAFLVTAACAAPAVAGLVALTAQL